MIEKIDPLCREQTYYSNRFSINVRLSEGGKVDGFFADVVSGQRESIYGFYIDKEASLKLVFFMGTCDSALSCERCFSGQIIRYKGNNRCLVIKWVEFDEYNSYTGVRSDFDVLFEQGTDVPEEIGQIIRQWEGLF